MMISLITNIILFTNAVELLKKWTHWKEAIFIHYREFVLSLEVKMCFRKRTSKCVHNIEVFLLCPLFGVSIIRGSTLRC